MKPKTDAERAKAYRERKKLRDAGLLPEREESKPIVYAKEPLSAFLSSNVERLESMDQARQELHGVDLDALFSKSGAASDQAGRLRDHIRSLTNVLEIVCAISNEYERAQIDREIERLRAAAATDDDAMQRVIRLAELRKQLEKNIRITVAEYEIGG